MTTKGKKKEEATFTLALAASIFTIFLLTTVDLVYGFFSVSQVLRRTLLLKFIIWLFFAVFTYFLARKYMITTGRLRDF